MAALLFGARKGAAFSCTSRPASSSGSSSPDYHQLSPDRRSSGLEADHLTPPDLNWVLPSSNKMKAQVQKSRWPGSANPREYSPSPAASTRYLLGDAGALFDVYDELDQFPASISIDPARFRSEAGDDSAVLRPSSSSRASSSSSSWSAAIEQGQIHVGPASSSCSSPYVLPSTRLIPIRKDDVSPSLTPSGASLLHPTMLHTEIKDAAFPSAPPAAAIQVSRFGSQQGQSSIGSSSSSSSSSGTRTNTEHEGADAVKSSSSEKSQVVVLRVSLHCKGCEAKVKKHISRMKGVTSFSVDLAEQKVTVIGDVTPLGVLSSVSKVKSAQFWPQ